MDVRAFVKNFVHTFTPFLLPMIRTVRGSASASNRRFWWNLYKVKAVDIFYGTDFYGYGYWEEDEPDFDRAYNYAPSSDVILKELMRIITPEDSVVDLGCGKGYVVYLFSKCHPAFVSGVELKSDLAKIAENNLIKIMPKGQAWQIYVEDVGKWEYYDDYNIFYMYNPFPKPVVDEVKENILQSVERHPRPVKVICWLPEFPEVFSDDARWRLLEWGGESAFRGGLWVFEAK